MSRTVDPRRKPQRSKRRDFDDFRERNRDRRRRWQDRDWEDWVEIDDEPEPTDY